MTVQVSGPSMATAPISTESLRAPFPWFGGKRLVAPIVWDRFGDVPNYCEPFAGSLAVLLGRPTAGRVETVNDIDSHLSNFWRALQAEPDAVAEWADYPVNEADLHARHRWLVETMKDRADRIIADPDYYDAKAAGCWVWGQCLWIGSGWCNGLSWQQKPMLQNDGKGVTRRRWQGGGQGGGSGVHAPTLTRQMPRLAAEGGSISGVTATPLVESEGLYDYLRALSSRLRRVRVCCGDWSRVLTPSVTTYVGTTAVFLDPPYSHDLRERCYAEDHDISADVRAWALAHGDNPDFRIALCGYVDEHGDHMPSSWECVPWKAHGGYSRSERGVKNRSEERIWFSPHCLNPANRLPFEVSA